MVPRQIKDNGISNDIIEIQDNELKTVITDFTMESGVRNLERAIGSICRVAAYKYAIEKDPNSFTKIVVDNSVIVEALGNKRIDSYLHERITRPGVAIGMAYTQVGGRALLIETTKFPGTGQVIRTGQLGEVMQESIGTALSWIKSNASRLGLTPIEAKVRQRSPEVKVIRGDEEREHEAKL